MPTIYRESCCLMVGTLSLCPPDAPVRRGAGVKLRGVSAWRRQKSLGQNMREIANLFPRHCERSEAIDLSCFAALAMTQSIYLASLRSQ
ncbi:hypothetical protein [Bradyrhizobium lablabi]|uniref:hypothetical protein n=1 Tax=Bradyrhizobium lablabi TaxID=722472 RepID=UPI000B1F314D|nr:hypothetical protein [Bradyrhizobium lablabi]